MACNMHCNKELQLQHTYNESYFEKTRSFLLTFPVAMGETASAPVESAMKDPPKEKAPAVNGASSSPVKRRIEAPVPSKEGNGDDEHASESSSESSEDESKEKKMEDVVVPSTPLLSKDHAAADGDQDSSKLRRISQLGPYRDGYMLVSLGERMNGRCRTCHTVFTYNPWKADYKWIKEPDTDNEIEAVMCIHRTCPGVHYNP